MENLDFFTEQFFVVAQFGHNLTLYLLIILSIVSISFIIERILFFNKIKKTQAQFSKASNDAVYNNDVSPLRAFTEMNTGYESEAIKLGFNYIKEAGTDGLQEYLDSYKQNIRPMLEKSLSALASIGSNAPFIGLLGTVFGVMEAFQSLATNQSDPGLVMIGISKALMATAIGLFVAIPATFAFNTFNKKSKTVLSHIDTIRDLCVAHKKKI
jgi:biopolymer transport protein ExbB/TolQ